MAVCVGEFLMDLRVTFQHLVSRRLVFNIYSRRSMPPRLPRYHMLCMPLLQNLVRKISYDNFRYCIIFNCFATCEDFLMHASMHAQNWQCKKKIVILISLFLSEFQVSEHIAWKVMYVNRLVKNPKSLSHSWWSPFLSALPALHKLQFLMDVHLFIIVRHCMAIVRLTIP